jgi:signal transduction histidine kinase
MQRISRELNASLELDRAMRITLEWAMRQTQAEAGMIGILEDGVRIMVQQGYGTLLEKFDHQIIPLDHPAMVTAIESGQPHRTIFDETNKTQAFLETAHSQLVIPIRRESKAIGLFLLESTAAENLKVSALEFLSRLADVAAIAIANSQLYTQVQYANNAKSKFVSFVAHELKNPMASIKGYTDLVVKGMAGEINEQQVKFLTTVLNNLDRMNTIVTDLSDQSKIEAGQLRLDFKDIEIPGLLEDAVRSIKNQIDDKQQVVQYEIAPDLPRVWGDKNRISQILVNLVSNANKYTPKEGQIFVGAEKSRNVWDERGPQEVVHVWVKDTGIGIPPDDQKHIFQQYYRTESSKDMAKGTGLGLNISKSLVEMQGGKIWFDSEIKKGTTFHFTVPISEN